MRQSKSGPMNHGKPLGKNGAPPLSPDQGARTWQAPSPRHLGVLGVGLTQRCAAWVRRGPGPTCHGGAELRAVAWHRLTPVRGGRDARPGASWQRGARMRTRREAHPKIRRIPARGIMSTFSASRASHAQPFTHRKPWIDAAGCAPVYAPPILCSNVFKGLRVGTKHAQRGITLRGRDGSGGTRG